MPFRMVSEVWKKLLIKWKPLLRPIPILFGFILFILAGIFNLDHFTENRTSEIIRVGTLEELKSYIEKNPGAIERKNKLDMTPLMNASYNGNEQAVKLLLKMGADIRATGLGSKLNALHCAAVNGNVNVANLLIDSNVEVNARSNKGETPLDIAQRNRHELFVTYLRAYGGKSSSELSVAPAP